MTHDRIASHPKCSSAVSTHQLSRRLRTIAASQCALVITAVVGRRRCTSMPLRSPVAAACRCHLAGFSLSQYRQPRATLPARYTAPQIYATSVLTCPMARRHETPVQTAQNMDPHQRWMSRRTAGKVFQACSSRGLGTYLEHQYAAWQSPWMNRWSCRLTTHALHVKARWWIGSTTVWRVLCKCISVFFDPPCSSKVDLLISSWKRGGFHCTDCVICRSYKDVCISLCMYRCVCLLIYVFIYLLVNLLYHIL